ncbi:MAG: DUF2202 domain-containing protein [Candidatus Paceibacterota bacterium]
MQIKKYIAHISIAAIFVLFIIFRFSGGDTKLSGTEFVNSYKNTPNSVLVDVRTPGEFAEGHIDGATNIDFENKNFIDEVQKLDKEKTYFVYCRSGSRSGQAISIMKSNGFKNIFELEGGIVSNKDELSLTISSGSDYVVDPSDMLDGVSLVSGIAGADITDKEIAGLIQMREEEKLARDVYTTLGGVWGSKIFSNISASEQTHTDSVKILLQRYGIKDPVTNDSVGVFTSKSMQDLYDGFIKKGKISLVDALVVGATVEDLDIRDLENLKKETTKEDIKITYNNLQKGSRNHLRAFVKNIQSNGGTYSPQYLSIAEYKSIIDSPQEKGRSKQ